MNFQKEMQKAYSMAQSGQFETAELILKKIIEKEDGEKKYQALANLAIIYINQGNLDGAKNTFETILEKKFDLAIFRNFQNLLKQQKNWIHLAEQCARYIHNNQLKDKTTNINYAIALRELGQFDEACSHINLCIQQNKNELDYYALLGYTLNKNNKYADAINVYREGLIYDRDNLTLNYNIGITLKNDNQTEESIKYLEKAGSINGNIFDIWITQAGNYIKIDCFEKAFECIKRARHLEPNNFLINFQLAVIESSLGNLDSAKEYLDAIIKRRPHDPEINYLLGLIYLKKGNYNDAKLYYRYRTKREINKYGRFDDFNFPELTKDTELLIGWEQGIGDQILFSRLLHSIIKKVSKLTVIVPDKLYKLLSFNYQEITFIKTSECEEMISRSPAVKINMGSIIFYVSDYKKEIKNTRYLDVEQSLVEKYEKLSKADGKKIIGLSWKSINKYNGRNKSFSLSDLKNLFQNDKYVFVNLQYGDVSEEISLIKKEYETDIKIINDIDYFNDMEKLSALIKVCDEVITCSNVTAHLAGSLGVSTRLILSKSLNKIWYWYDDKNNSTWYPKVKYYHQVIQGSWVEPIKNIIVDLDRIN